MNKIAGKKRKKGKSPEKKNDLSKSVEARNGVSCSLVRAKGTGVKVLGLVRWVGHSVIKAMTQARNMETKQNKTNQAIVK